MNTYYFKTTCDINHLKDIRSFVTKTLEAFQIVETQINLMVLAVDEICANRILHNHAHDISKVIEIKIENKNNDCLIFEVIDNGLPFDISSYQEPDLADIIKSKRKGGMGLKLVHRIMDSVEVIPNASNSIFRMQKNVKLAS